MPITREFINGRISFSVRTPKRKGIATLAVKIPLFYKEGRKSLTTIGFFKKSGDIFFGATSHIVKPKKISWLRTPEISRFRGFFSRFLAFSQPRGLRIQSAEKKISFQKNGFGQDLNPVVPVFKGRKCDDFTHLLPFFRIFIC